MSLRTRIFVDDLSLQNIQLSKDQQHYLSHVLRLREGEKIRIFDGKNGEWSATINNSIVIKDIHLKQQINTNPLHLAFSPIKGETASDIINKGTQLGITEFHPIIAKRTIVKDVNQDKLQKTAIEASQQCERLDIPKIHKICSIEQFTHAFKGNLMFFYEKAVSSNIKLPQNDLENCLLIGPEGGFTDAEASTLSKISLSISLGSRIIRAETAIVAAISFYNTITNNWK